MRTKQNNLNPVERTRGASGLLGRSGQRHQADRGYFDPSLVLVWATAAAAMLGLSGFITEGSGKESIDLIA